MPSAQRKQDAETKGGARYFATTHWSVVLAAGRSMAVELGGLLELVALILGLAAWRTGAGKAGLSIAGSYLVLAVGAVPVLTLQVRPPGRGAPKSPAVSLRSFATTDATISKDLVVDGDGWGADCTEARTIKLFEVSNPGVDQCVVTYRARLKTEGLDGRAYLEMWCRLPGRGEFFSKGFANAVTGSTDWSSYEVPFFLQKGEAPDLIRLNLVVEGTGKIWVKEVQLLKSSLPTGPATK